MTCGCNSNSNNSSNDKETKAVKTSISQLRKQGVTVQNINESDSNKHFSYSESGDIEQQLYDAIKPNNVRTTRLKPESEYWTKGLDNQNNESNDSS